MLDWRQLPELLKAGVEIGAHSYSHPQRRLRSEFDAVAASLGLPSPNSPADLTTAQPSSRAALPPGPRPLVTVAIARFRNIDPTDRLRPPGAVRLLDAPGGRRRQRRRRRPAGCGVARS